MKTENLYLFSDAESQLVELGRTTREVSERLAEWRQVYGDQLQVVNHWELPAEKTRLCELSIKNTFHAFRKGNATECFKLHPNLVRSAIEVFLEWIDGPGLNITIKEWDNSQKDWKNRGSKKKVSDAFSRHYNSQLIAEINRMQWEVERAKGLQ